jgi:tripartite-type tricarboxylate transporter receptor subunit TctC
MTPEKFGDFIRADINRWTKLAQDRGIQLDS